MQAEFLKKERYGIEDLLSIMALLRGESGCPWDREQSHASIRKNFIEETYEAVEAIDSGDAALLREELGDVLFQVVFHAQMEKERGSFDFSDVCDGICKKLIVRHPHVFGDETLSDSGAIHSRWEEIKKETKGQKTASETLSAVPKVLPALMRAEKVQQRAKRALSFSEDTEEALTRLDEAKDALFEAVRDGDSALRAEALGNFLFSAVAAARICELDAEECLYAATESYVGRFQKAEEKAAASGKALSALSREEFLSLLAGGQK